MSKFYSRYFSELKKKTTEIRLYVKPATIYSKLEIKHKTVEKRMRPPLQDLAGGGDGGGAGWVGEGGLGGGWEVGGGGRDPRESGAGILEFSPAMAGRDMTPANYDFEPRGGGSGGGGGGGGGGGDGGKRSLQGMAGWWQQ